MSVNSVMQSVRRKAAQILEIRAQSLADEEYGLLERYKVGSGIMHPGNRVPSSAPGDPPARQTGHLQESIKYVIDRQKLIAVVGPFEGPPTVIRPKPVPYAALLEYGTRHIAPRPFVRPALESWKAKWRRP
ncbi:MAG: hypothetical protein N2045_13870 [Fimbriimonadales bacterium]|nr:hypothetical protein [Fimbriimonadales bacterium]